MKKLTIALTTALALAAAASAHAQSSPFNVTVNLTSACTLTAPADVAFTYTSFQGGNQASTGGGFTVRCTNGLPYTLALDAAGGTVIGLNYTLALSAPGGTGSGAAQPYTVSGTMVSGQAGNCAVGACAGSQARTLTVSF